MIPAAQGTRLTIMLNNGDFINGKMVSAGEHGITVKNDVGYIYVAWQRIQQIAWTEN